MVPQQVRQQQVQQYGAHGSTAVLCNRDSNNWMDGMGLDSSYPYTTRDHRGTDSPHRRHGLIPTVLAVAVQMHIILRGAAAEKAPQKGHSHQLAPLKIGACASRGYGLPCGLFPFCFMALQDRRTANAFALFNT